MALEFTVSWFLSSVPTLKILEMCIATIKKTSQQKIIIAQSTKLFHNQWCSVHFWLTVFSWKHASTLGVGNCAFSKIAKVRWDCNMFSMMIQQVHIQKCWKSLWSFSLFLFNLNYRQDKTVMWLSSSVILSFAKPVGPGTIIVLWPFWCLSTILPQNNAIECYATHWRLWRESRNL